jgi:hypothetical protein
MQFIAIRWSGGRVIDILITYQTRSQENRMNIVKNMEAVLIAAVAIAAAASIATAAVPARHQAGAVAAPFEGKMQVVTIVGKRLTAAEKENVAP